MTPFGPTWYLHSCSILVTGTSHLEKSYASAGSRARRRHSKPTARREKTIGYLTAMSGPPPIKALARRMDFKPRLRRVSGKSENKKQRKNKLRRKPRPQERSSIFIPASAVFLSASSCHSSNLEVWTQSRYCLSCCGTTVLRHRTTVVALRSFVHFLRLRVLLSALGQN